MHIDGCSRPTIFRRCTRLRDQTLGQGIPLHLQLTDLLVQVGDQRGADPGVQVLTVAEDASGAIGEAFLLGMNPARMDLVPAGQLAHRTPPPKLPWL